MPEHQTTEYKSSWHDDYLKWVCGFANAQGGRFYIGRKQHIKNEATIKYDQLKKHESRNKSHRIQTTTHR